MLKIIVIVFLITHLFKSIKEKNIYSILLYLCIFYLNYKIGKSLFASKVNSNGFNIDWNYFLNDFNNNDNKYLIIFIAVAIQYFILNILFYVVATIISKSYYKDIILHSKDKKIFEKNFFNRLYINEVVKKEDDKIIKDDMYELSLKLLKHTGISFLLKNESLILCMLIYAFIFFIISKMILASIITIVLIIVSFAIINFFNGYLISYQKSIKTN